MKKLILFFWLALCSAAWAQQIQGPLPTNALACAFNTAPPTITSGFWGYVQCDANGKLITSGGGGGGLSVQDQATWTQGISNMTPQGCEYNDASTLTSGTQGTTRCTLKRAQIVDIDSSGSQFHTDITAPAKIVDGAGVNLLTIKPASTAPVATDTSGVVALNPNSPGIIATGGSTTALSVPINLNSQYPVNSVTTAPTAITGNATGSTGAVVGTLAAAASKTTFICGFNVSTIGGTAPSSPITVAGLIGSSQVYQTPINAAAGQILITQNFNPCIPASAVNTAITITTTAAAAATAVDVNSWGYQL